MTLSCWLAVTPSSVTVSVGVPGIVSWYSNLAVLEPCGIVIVAVGSGLPLTSRNVAPLEVLLRLRVTPPPAEVGSPTTIVPDAWPASIDCEPVRNVGCPVTVSCSLACTPAAVAVTVGVPTSPSSYSKLAVLAPCGMTISARPAGCL